jgi:parallel beta-helix repeat protein
MSGYTTFKNLRVTGDFDARTAFDASALPVTATGGVTAATLSARFGHVLNVRDDFGAVGNGTTDDTAKFQLAAAVGGRIYVPAGTYILSRVDLTTSVQFIGEGAGSICKRKASTETSSFGSYTGMFNLTVHGITVEFRDLVLDGNESNQQVYEAYGATVAFTNLSGTAPSKLIVRAENCVFQNTTQAAIRADGDTASTGYEELHVNNCRFYNTRVGRAQGDVLVASPTGYGPDYITATDKVYLTVTNNTFIFDKTLATGEFPPTGIRVTYQTDTGNADAVRGLFANNYFRGVGRGHKDLSGTHPENDVGCIDFYARGRSLRIINNYFENCVGVPIRGKTNADLVMISGNIIDSVLYGPGIAINPGTHDDQAGRIVITNNIIKNVYGYGINVIGSSTLTVTYAQDVVISNNIVDTVATYSLNGTAAVGYGIYTRYTHGVTITNNEVRSAGQYGIYCLNTQDGTISGNRVEASGTRNFLTTAVTGRWTVTANTSISSSSRGYELVATSGGTEVLVCSNNISDGSVDYGIYGRYWTRASLIGNQVYNVTGSGRGFYLQDIATTLDYSHNVAGTGVATPSFNSATDTGIRYWGNSWERRQIYGTAAPVSGTWAVGDTLWHTTPAASGNIGWTCTTAGSPGTWKSFGTIAA